MAYCKGANENTSIKSLKLAVPQFSVKILESLGSLLKNKGPLQSLTISGNHQEDPPYFDIFTSNLKENTALKRLNLSNNSLGYVCFSDLAEAMEVNESLEKLALGWNNGTHKSAIAIAHIIKKSKSLKVLDISHDDLGDDAGDIISQALYENTSLIQELKFKNNDFSAASSQSMEARLKINNSLKLA